MKTIRTDVCIAGALRLIVAMAAILAPGAGAASEAQVTPHPVPLEFASDRYGVTVNGQPVTVFFAAMNIHFASFDFTGQAGVQVTINDNDYNRHDNREVIKPDDFWQGNAIVRPLQTLYLASGAVLFGCVNVWNAENVRIRGRGTIVYYGPGSRNVDTGWMNKRNWHPLTTHAVKGLTVDGVTFVGRSRGWTIQLWKTFGATFNNIKIIAAFPENLNGDGID